MGFILLVITFSFVFVVVLRKVGLLQGWFKDVFSGSREQI